MTSPRCRGLGGTRLVRAFLKGALPVEKYTVSIVRYEQPLESLRRVIDLCGGLTKIHEHAKVFIKPNVCFWKKGILFPKWGIITTSRIVEDVVVLLKEHGIHDITIGEGIVLGEPQDTATPADAFEKLGYGNLRRKHGVNVRNIHERPFRNMDLGSGVELNFSLDFLESDFVVNVPVLKTHLQTVVSLGIKNIKGVIDVESRKKCHRAGVEQDLDFMVARLANALPPTLTILDGIFTNEIGPSFDGKIRRSNVLIASFDVLSADKVGAKVLGHDPWNVRHIVHAAEERKRPTDLSDVEILGEDIEKVASFHEYSLLYNEDGTLPESLHQTGVSGLTIPKYDHSICTYCAAVLPSLVPAIKHAWKGEPYQDVEILTGKVMKPSPGKGKTILVGSCMYGANRDNHDIKQMIAVKGCPPRTHDIVSALREGGIEVDPFIFEILSNSMIFMFKKYAGNPDFDESFFRINQS